MPDAVIDSTRTPFPVRRRPRLRRAMRLAFSGRRGPVHLTIPIDLQERSVDEEQVVLYEPDEYRAKIFINQISKA